MEFLVLLFHVSANICLGLSILRLLQLKNLNLATLSIALALGMMIETLIIWLLALLGVSIIQSFIAVAIVSLGALIYLHFKSYFVFQTSSLFKRPTLWEGVISFFIIEKVIWSLYSLAKLPVYFDDALNHWSGRGKALLDGTNWSWDPESMYFMGRALGHEQYPLFASIWRAVNAALLGRHDAGLERVDGFLLWLIILVITVHWITQQSEKRWLGLAGAAIIAAIPLQTWHATAGYAEIYIQAYLLMALFCLFQNRYILAGILSAGMIWSKNEGLIIFIPCIISCLAVKLLLEKSTPAKDRITKFLAFNLSWMLAILPWILFKLIKGVGFTIPTNKGLGYVEGALSKMAHAIFNSPSSSILWIFLLLTMILCAKRIWNNKTLLPLAISCIILLIMMTFVFTSTGAYNFLENQMTIHRSLLQIAPPFVILVCLSLLGYHEPKEA